VTYQLVQKSLLALLKLQQIRAGHLLFYVNEASQYQPTLPTLSIVDAVLMGKLSWRSSLNGCSARSRDRPWDEFVLFWVIGSNMAGVLGSKGPGASAGQSQPIIVEVSASAKPSEVRALWLRAAGYKFEAALAFWKPECL
jgi:hypothetical protein